jgi:DNA-binding response OmpR family regulator
LRRSGSETGGRLDVGPLALDVERRTVAIDGGEPVSLTALEFRLLHMLVVNAGSVLSADRLTTHVWGLRGMGDRRSLKQLVHRLRAKIEPDAAQPRLLRTEPGRGYRLMPSGETASDSDRGA